jgi:superoxide reductase
MVELKLFKCSVCGNLVELLDDRGGTLVCCGQQMKELKPNTVDAAVEKHVPQMVRENGKVTVTIGSIIHPMTEEHYIGYIYVVTEQLVYRKKLNPGDQPVMEVFIDDAEPIVAYEWCNIHGFWKSN